MAYKERKTAPFSSAATSVAARVQDDVTIFNWTGTNITSMTPTRVDTATAGTPTGGVTFNATDSVAAANMQVAIRALGGIYADATVVAGATADNMVITVKGGYDITWAQAGGVGTFTESGAAGADTATPGSVAYTSELPIGTFAEILRVQLPFAAFNDKSVDVLIKDKGDITNGKTIYSRTALDLSAANHDVLVTLDGVEGSDGASTGNGSPFAKGPLKVKLTTSAPIPSAVCKVFCKMADDRVSAFRERSTGAIATPGTGTYSFNLGADVGVIKRIRLESSADTTVAPTIKDADGFTVYTKTSTNYTTAVEEGLTHDGVDQDGNAVTNTLEVVAKSPLKLTMTGLDSGTFKVTTWVEV